MTELINKNKLLKYLVHCDGELSINDIISIIEGWPAVCDLDAKADVYTAEQFLSDYRRFYKTMCYLPQCDGCPFDDGVRCWGAIEYDGFDVGLLRKWAKENPEVV